MVNTKMFELVYWDMYQTVHGVVRVANAERPPSMLRVAQDVYEAGYAAVYLALYQAEWLAMTLYPDEDRAEAPTHLGLKRYLTEVT